MTVGAFDPELFARYRKARAGSPLRSALENRLVIENTPLVKTLVDQMLGRGEVKRRGKFGSQRQAFAAIDWDEAMQAGRIALMKALQGFDPSKSKLSSYLVWKVRYELQCLIGRGKKAVELDLVGEQRELDELGGAEETGLAAVEDFTAGDVEAWAESGQWPESLEELREARAAALPVDARPVLAVFLEEHLVFAPSGRVAASALFGRLEAVAWPAPPPRAALVEQLRARGCVERRVRTPWSAASRGFGGVRLQTSARAAVANDMSETA